MDITNGSPDPRSLSDIRRQLTDDCGSWRPRHPDPALTGADWLKRPHAYTPDMPWDWVFLQSEIWVDFWGNEIEIAAMPRDYLINAIGFCLLQAERISRSVREEIAFRYLLCAVVGDETLFGELPNRALLDVDEAEQFVSRLPVIAAMGAQVGRAAATEGGEDDVSDR